MKNAAMKTPSAKASAPKSRAGRSAANGTGSGKRSGDGSQGMSAIELLMQDHRNVDALFQQFEDEDEGSPERLSILHAISFELTLHARVEEELLYPAARDVLGEDAKDLLDEAAVEHGSLKHMLVELATCDGGDYFFKAKVKVLSEYVKHHVEEEENELFPMLEAAGVDLEALGARIAARKQVLAAAYAALEGGGDGDEGDEGFDQDGRRNDEQSNDARREGR